MIQVQLVGKITINVLSIFYLPLDSIMFNQNDSIFSVPPAWDCSAWVRTYALFLEERLECFRVLKYDIEGERLPKPAQGQEKVSITLLNFLLTILHSSKSCLFFCEENSINLAY